MLRRMRQSSLFQSLSRLFALLVLVTGLAACSTTDASLVYTGPAIPFASGPPVVGSVIGTDLRNEKDPGWYGAVRGGFGNPIKVLRTPGPLADTVALAFSNALARRGLIGPPASAPLTMQVEIATFFSDQVINRESTIDLNLVLRRRSDHAVIYRDAISTDMHEDNDPFSVGIFGSIEKLRAFNERTLDLLIDKALSKPGFLVAIQGATARLACAHPCKPSFSSVLETRAL